MEIIKNLAALLRDIEGDPILDRSVMLPAMDSPAPLRKILNTLGTCGLLRREDRPARLMLTDDAQYFLESGDELFLIAVLHANVRFLGEALANLGDGLTHEELRHIADDQYGLKWESQDQIRRRVYWLRAAGLVDLWSNNKNVPTARGLEFLRRLDLPRLEDLPHRRQSTAQPVEIPQPPAALAARLTETDQAALLSRRRPMGYVAGGWRVEVLNRLANAATPSITRNEFKNFCVQEFKVAESSAEQTLNTLRAFEILEQVGPDSFAATELAASCLASGEPLDLIRLLHLRVALLGETLEALDGGVHSRTVVSIFAERYPEQHVRVSRADVTTRLALLEETGLVERIGLVVRRTPLGEALIQTLPLLNRGGPRVETQRDTVYQDSSPLPGPAVSVGSGDVRSLSIEIVPASTDSADYQRFERVIADAFRSLGVQVETHGGPSKTDVILNLWQSPTSHLRIAVEAKTDGGGIVTDQDVKFPRLGRHRERHNAQCTVLIGPKFDGWVEKEASKDKVALLTARQLANAIVRHARTPLTPREISALVTVQEAGELETIWLAAERRQEALGHVLHSIWKSGNDPVDIEFSAGALGVNDIWRETKNALKTPLSKIEIEEALAFLEAPVIAGLVKHGNGFAATAPPSLIAARLRALANAIESTGMGTADIGSTPDDVPTPSSPRSLRAKVEEVDAAVDASAVRAWAEAQGRNINPRGRLPGSLIRDYQRANELLSE